MGRPYDESGDGSVTESRRSRRGGGRLLDVFGLRNARLLLGRGGRRGGGKACRRDDGGRLLQGQAADGALLFCADCAAHAQPRGGHPVGRRQLDGNERSRFLDRFVTTTATSTTGFEAYDSRPWLKHYVGSAKPDLEALDYRNLGDVVARASREFADAPAFTTCLPTGTTGTLTYAQVDRLSDEFAAYLRFEIGLQKGDRVAIQSPNCL